MSGVSEIRLEQGLREALGPDIARLLEEPGVTDICLNEDGRIWVDRIGRGRDDTGYTMAADAAGYSLRLLASHAGTVLTIDNPLLNAEMPGTGERIAATVFSVTSRPTFAIRIPPIGVFEETDFVDIDVHSSGAYEALSGKREKIDWAIENRKNVLVAGGTGSGKTSLLSSFLKRTSISRDRCLIIEDTREIQISAPDCIRFVASAGADQRSLVKHALRYRPDRLILGEVRDGDVAISLLNALNSGHAGSFCTIHADSALLALRKFEWLCRQGCGDPQSEAIADVFGCVVFCWRAPDGRRCIGDVIMVRGYDDGRFLYD